jgi:polysaccharide biosynthesis transport protein
VVGKLDQSVAGLLVLEQEAASNRLLYQDMYTKLEEANLSAGLGGGVITVSDPARAPAKPSWPNRFAVLAAALCVGVFGGSATALAADHFQNILYSGEEFASVIPYPQLAVIPNFLAAARRRRKAGVGEPGIKHSEAWLLRDPGSPVSEAFRQLRTSILMSRSGQPPKTLLLTSALSGDGKTATSLNLASALAYQGARVLLVDADMRRPSLHLVASSRCTPGLSNILTGAATLDEAIQSHSEIPGLSILPAGVVPPTPAELLGSEQFRALLGELRDRYDYVVLDSPPLVAVTDPLLLAPLVEGVVLVSRPGHDTRPALRRSVALLDRPGIHVLGFVLNGASHEPGYYYRRYGQGEFA